MQCLAEMSETASRSDGGCGYSIFWFGCNAVIRSRRSSRSCPKKKKRQRRALNGAWKFESDARTHRTPKALRAKNEENVRGISRELWECARVLASLWFWHRWATQSRTDFRCDSFAFLRNKLHNYLTP